MIFSKKLVVLWFNIIIITLLLVLHFLIKDAYGYVLSLCFYVLPLPIIILICCFLSFFLKRRQQMMNLGLAIILTGVWVSRSYSYTPINDIESKNLKILFWNASHDRGFNDAFNINKSIPDVVVIAEYDTYKFIEEQNVFSRYYAYKHPSKAFVVFSKTPIFLKTVCNSPYGTSIINFELKGINFYAIDVSGSLDIPRLLEFNFINKKIAKTENTVLLGDFNVPYESVLLDNIKRSFKHTFTEKGNGFRETWCWGIPLLSLDQIWVSKDINVLKATKLETFQSDHSLITATIKL